MKISPPRLEGLLRRLKTPVFWVFFCVAITLSYSWMSPQVNAPNERSRVYLSLAVLNSGTLSLNKEVKKYGAPFDLAERDGHFYSDKAPGSSFLAVPALAVYKVMGGSDSIEKLVNFVRRFVMIPFTLLGLLMLRRLLIGMEIEAGISNRVTIAYALGTSVFHYGAAFYGHALVSSAAIGAALGIQRGLSSENPRRRFAWRVFAGFSGATAFAIEYQAALICVGVAIAYLSVREHRTIRAVLAPALGASLPLGATLLYNRVAFGGFFKTSYNFLYYDVSEGLHSEGVYGITWPTVDSIYGLLLSPSHGLLFCAPLVFVGLLALGALGRRTRWLGIYVGFCTLSYFLMAAGSSVWFGAWAFGPRLLVPVFGLAAIAAAAGLEALSDSPARSLATRTYIAAGVAYNALIITAFPELPPRITNPLKSIAFGLFERGRISPNLGMALFGIKGSASFIPLAILLIGVIGYLIYQRSTPERPLGWRRAGITISAVIILFGALSYGYPEKNPEQATEKLLDHLASRRLRAK